MDSKHLMPTYARKPVAFWRGEGVWLYPGTDDEDRYLDALSGFAVCGLGHATRAVTAAIAEQSAHLVHTSNLYTIPLQEKLAARLCQLSGMDAAFFCNSGAEANEAAIKLARLHAHDNKAPNAPVIVTENSFHGRTLAALSATGNPAFQTGFDPLVPGFVHVPYDNLEAVQAVLEASPRGGAVLVEPIQCEGGINIPAPDYLAGLRELCDHHGALLILDEYRQVMGALESGFAPARGVGQKCGGRPRLGNWGADRLCWQRQQCEPVYSRPGRRPTFGGNPRPAGHCVHCHDESQVAPGRANRGTKYAQRFREKRPPLCQGSFAQSLIS